MQSCHGRNISPCGFAFALFVRALATEVLGSTWLEPLVLAKL